jgi:hypothetical protein
MITKSYQIISYQMQALLTPFLAYIISFQEVQEYLKPIDHDEMPYQSQLVRACLLTFGGILMLKKLQKKSPKMFALVQSWSSLHPQRNAYELFSIYKPSQ